jgi:hypothetical protein
VESAHISQIQTWFDSKPSYWEHVTFLTHASGSEDPVSWCTYDGDRTDSMDLASFQTYVQIQRPVDKGRPDAAADGKNGPGWQSAL